MHPGETRSLCFLSRLKDARQATHYVRRAVANLLPAAAANLLELAVSEALTNIIRHGYAMRDDQPIRLEVRHAGTTLELLVEDEAPVAFSLQDVPLPRLDVERIPELPEGGWGVYLMRQAVDELTQERAGRRNRLRLKKRLPAPLAAPLPAPFTAFRDAPPPDAEAATLDALRQELAVSEQSSREMAEELSTAYESLNIFYTFSRDVSTLTDETVLCRKILDNAMISAEASWGVLRLSSPAGFRLKASAGQLPAPPPPLMPPDAPGLETAVAAALQEQVTRDADGNPVMGLPIAGMDRLLGILLLGRQAGRHNFSAGDAKLARALADQAGISLENQCMVREVLDARLARQELDIAHDLQQQLYPRQLPQVPGLALFAQGIAARQVGGDYLAFLTRRTPDGTLDFIIADAMGKGMSAAFFSILTHVACRSILDLAPARTPGEILTAFNRIMTPDFERFGMYMTCLYGRIDTRQAELRYACAGHCPPLLTPPDGRTRQLETLDYMLGVAADTVFQEGRHPFPPGSRLLAYTDGFTDVTDSEGRMRGHTALLNAWQQLAAQPLEAACRDLLRHALDDAPPGGLQDDIALLAIDHQALNQADAARERRTAPPEAASP